MAQAKMRLRALLKRVETVTRTDMRYLASGGFWLTAAQVVSSVTAIALAIALANLIPKDAYGIYKFVVSGAGIIAAVSLTGMGPAVIRAVSRGFEGALRRGLRVSLVWNSVLFLIGCSVAGYYFLNDNLTLAGAFVIVAIFLPLRQSFFLFDAYLRGKKFFRASAGYNAAGDIIPISLLIATAFLTDDPLAILFVFFASYAVIGVLFHFMALRLTPPENDKTEPGTTPYAAHLSVMGVIGGIANYIDSILVFHYLGAAPLAVYSFAMAPARELGTVGRVLQQLALPKLGLRSIPELQTTLPRKALIAFGIAAGIVASFILAAPYLYQWFLPQYLDAVVYAQVAALVVLFMPAPLFTQTFVAHARKKELYVINTFIPLLKIIFPAVLLPLYGLWGGVASLLATHTIHFILVLALFLRAK
jgi:O-antigen/teichoic acid export membrane protein